jgi:hypothetical protein
MELDEVWVSGKKLARRVADAEDKLFRLYNKLNKNNIYDVHCGSISLEPGSMIMKRTCLPGYLSDISYISYPVPSYGFSMDSCPSGLHFTSSCASTYSGFGSGYMGGGRYAAPVTLSSGSRGSMNAAISEFDSVPPSVVASYRREAYAKNVLDVITSDPQLVEMGTDVVLLYREMELVQSRYARMRAAAGMDAKGKRPIMFPRPR